MKTTNANLCASVLPDEVAKHQSVEAANPTAVSDKPMSTPSDDSPVAPSADNPVAPADHESDDALSEQTTGPTSGADTPSDNSDTDTLGEDTLDDTRDETTPNDTAGSVSDGIEMIDRLNERLQRVLSRVRELEEQYERQITQTRRDAYKQGVDETLRATAGYAPMTPPRPSTIAPVDFLADIHPGFWD